MGWPFDPSSQNRVKQKVTGKTGVDGTKDVEMIVPLKRLSNL